MPDCTAQAEWNGTIPNGDGEVALGSGRWAGEYGTPEAANATDPEELLAASHASCFAMTAAYALDEAGYSPERVTVGAAATLEIDAGSVDIASIELTVDPVVPGATGAELAAVVERAERHCPVSKVLSGTDVTVTVAGTE